MSAGTVMFVLGQSGDRARCNDEQSSRGGRLVIVFVYREQQQSGVLFFLLFAGSRFEEGTGHVECMQLEVGRHAFSPFKSLSN